MNILYLTDQFYLYGGVERVLSQKLNFLVKQAKYKVYLVTIENKNKSFCYKTSDQVCHTDLSINYHRSKSFFHISNLIKLPFHVYSLNKKIKHKDGNEQCVARGSRAVSANPT